MKANKVVRRRSKRGWVAICAILFLAALVIGTMTAYSKLRDLWQELGVVTDVSTQVTCTDGTMVRSATVLDRLGVRNGTCLSRIDFDTKRREILRDIPNIRAISITWTKPNRLDIVVNERQPVVRLAVHGKPGVTGRVADSEGMVFTCRRGTSMLPTIRENAASVTPIGHMLEGRALAALQLVETARESRFAALGILDADTSKQDYILATLGNYSQAKIAWKGMDAPTAANRENLVSQLDHLQKAIKSNVATEAKTWNATEENRIYADTRENIL